MGADFFTFLYTGINDGTYHLGGWLKEERDLETTRFSARFGLREQRFHKITATPGGGRRKPQLFDKEHQTGLSKISKEDCVKTIDSGGN